MRVLLLGGTPFKGGLLEVEGFDLLGGDWGSMRLSALRIDGGTDTPGRLPL